MKTLGKVLKFLKKIFKKKTLVYEPVNRLEEVFIKAAENPARRPEFYRLLFHFELLCLGDIKTREDGSAKGNVRIDMIADIMGVLDYVDTICLVAGDGDFACLGSRLKERSVRMELYSFAVASAMDLKQAVSEFYEIDESYLFQEVVKV